MEEDAQELEQTLAKILYAASRKKGLTQREMGEIAFGVVVSPDRQIRMLFNEKKRRALKVSELFAWATGLNMDPARTISRALEILEGNSEAPDIDIGKTPGRKPGAKDKG